MKKSDQYLKLVEWSEEDGCYVGSCPGLMLGGVHGPDEVLVYRRLVKAVEDWLASLEEDGLPLPPATAGRTYSGKLVMRLGPDLHKDLALEAMRVKESLNSYCVRVLKSRRESGRT
ncbi:MAG: toxin-antitoxin system HicB family antitoxin [bacterium]|jgi:predicted HicB family RNase H-like nuclease|nr:toxin-antitoxin system HicB family antitoxin [bacterium]